ncbi:MAG: response regulator [Eubacterium sp.]|nr:response regulator [Eubacterium sp.]
MGRRLLLVGDTKSFMVKAIVNSLKSSGYDVVTCGPHRSNIEAVMDRPKIVLFYLDDVPSIEDGLIYFKENTTNDDTVLLLIGAEMDLQEAYFRIPKNRITATVIRPVNIKVLSKQLERIFAEKSSRPQKDKKEILVVDDDGTMLRTIKTWLSKKYDVYMCNSGPAAIKFLDDKIVDLILLDFEMPGMNGPQVLEVLRTDPDTNGIPVMFLTAKSDKDSVMTGISLHPENYLLKTMNPEDLIKTVDDFFEN